MKLEQLRKEQGKMKSVPLARALATEEDTRRAVQTLFDLVDRLETRITLLEKKKVVQ